MKRRLLKILAELLRNSKQSDREIARKLGVSQATISRMRTRLEREGYIKEYTLIPQFNKIGYKLMAITFALSKALDKETAERTRRLMMEGAEKVQTGFVMIERGRGLGFDAVIITFHKDYSSYSKFIRWLKQIHPTELVEVEKIDSFLIDLDDEVRYFPLSFSALAEDLTLQAQESEG